MLTKIKAAGLKSVPYLEKSKLMQLHNGELALSTDKVNVLVGENGAGKSALLTTLAYLTQSYYTGSSCFNREYLEDNFWEKPKDKWYAKAEYLKGLSFEGTLNQGLFYKPILIPGDEKCIATSMLLGYSNQALKVGNAIKDKSSGQARLNLLKEVMKSISDKVLLSGVAFVNARVSEATLTDPEKLKGQWKADESLVLYNLLKNTDPSANLVLMDEPEQSLDLLEELKFWNWVSSIDTTKYQVVISSHSIQPLLFPDQFNIIEASPGYLDSCYAMLKGVIKW